MNGDAGDADAELLLPVAPHMVIDPTMVHVDAPLPPQAPSLLAGVQINRGESVKEVMQSHYTTFVDVDVNDDQLTNPFGHPWETDEQEGLASVWYRTEDEYTVALLDWLDHRCGEIAVVTGGLVLDFGVLLPNHCVLTKALQVLRRYPSVQHLSIQFCNAGWRMKGCNPQAIAQVYASPEDDVNGIAVSTLMQLMQYINHVSSIRTLRICCHGHFTYSGWVLQLSSEHQVQLLDMLLRDNVHLEALEIDAALISTCYFPTYWNMQLVSEDCRNMAALCQRLQLSNVIRFTLASECGPFSTSQSAQTGEQISLHIPICRQLQCLTLVDWNNHDVVPSLLMAIATLPHLIELELLNGDWRRNTMPLNEALSLYFPIGSSLQNIHVRGPGDQTTAVEFNQQRVEYNSQVCQLTADALETEGVPSNLQHIVLTYLIPTFDRTRLLHPIAVKTDHAANPEDDIPLCTLTTNIS